MTSVTENHPSTSRSASVVVLLLLLLLALMALAAVAGRLTAPSPAGDKFSGEITNISPDAIAIETDDGQINGLLAYEGKPLSVGDKVTGREIGDPDVIYVDPLP